MCKSVHQIVIAQPDEFNFQKFSFEINILMSLSLKFNPYLVRTSRLSVILASRSLDCSTDLGLPVKRIAKYNVNRLPGQAFFCTNHIYNRRALDPPGPLDSVHSFAVCVARPIDRFKIERGISSTGVKRTCLISRSRPIGIEQSNILPKRKMSSELDPEKSAGKASFDHKFLDSAAHGNLEEFNALLGAVDIDVKSDRGWTALMFAARNGHVPIISALIEKGCDVQSLNASGQTALDIAQFWNHSDAVAILTQHKENVLFDQVHNYYSVNPLYRASDLRKDASTLLDIRRKQSSKFVVFENQRPFLLPPKGPIKKFKFAIFSCDQLPEEMLEDASVIFLGLETWEPSSCAWFAVDLKDKASDAALKVFPTGSFVTPFPATMQMEDTHAGIFAEAHSILCWLDRYRFCPTCGTSQKVVDGGYKQVCNNPECSSHKGVHNTCYPRVDPSLIMLVVSPDKKMCLLGRQKRFPPKMYSCLAGFMEPGECIEDTCRREVEEESGVKVGRVEYHSSQPWPFPATLMLGCIAFARTDTIKVDETELEEARWFPRVEVAQMLAGKHPDGLFVPPKQAIAHQLIKSWISSNQSNL